MDLYETITSVYPELTENDFGNFGTIVLQDDADGQGAYLASWTYAKPIPEGLKLGK
jgi:hypothetical protein